MRNKVSVEQNTDKHSVADVVLPFQSIENEDDQGQQYISKMKEEKNEVSENDEKEEKVYYDSIEMFNTNEQLKCEHLTYIMLMMLLENELPSQVYDQVAHVQEKDKVLPTIGHDLRQLVEKMYLVEPKQLKSKVSKSWSIEIKGLIEELKERKIKFVK